MKDPSSNRLPRSRAGRRPVRASIGLIFFYAPTDADQGFSQRIFYFHVPIALTSYACFGWGAWKALRLSGSGDEDADLESYVAIHQGVIFGSLTLLTGSIWAKISWGVWWAWGDNQLVLFLSSSSSTRAYFMLRFSVDPGPQRANMCAVYALFGVVLIPISFLAIRLAKSFIHPVVFNARRPADVGSQFLTFCVSLVAMIALFATLYQLELAGQAARRAPARAAGAARVIGDARQPSPEREVPRGGVSRRLRGGARLRADHRREAAAARARRRRAGRARPRARAPMLELLFWPALIGYGEAALAYASPRSRARDLGRADRLAAQTALLAVQAARTDGFPWSSWAGSLNLFVWLVVSAYLIWGCRPRYRLLGLAVMPLAAALFLVAGLGGGTEAGEQSSYGNLFLVLHVGFVLAAFAGFTLAAALAGLYLWRGAAPEAARGRHPAAALPPLGTLERVTRGRSRSRCRC